MSFVTFLTTIWGEGVVFGWLVDLTGISSLLVWGTVGVISLRFRAAWKAQGRSTKDLPYTQPLFPVLPWLTIILAIAMLVAQGYASVVETPFDVKVRARSLCPFFVCASVRLTRAPRRRSSSPGGPRSRRTWLRTSPRECRTGARARNRTS